jgi:hypothetical protein
MFVRHGKKSGWETYTVILASSKNPSMSLTDEDTLIATGVPFHSLKES